MGTVGLSGGSGLAYETDDDDVSAGSSDSARSLALGYAFDAGASAWRRLTRSAAGLLVELGAPVDQGAAGTERWTVADDYDEMEVLADVVGADAVETLTFSQAIALLLIEADGGDARLTSTAQTPAATLGARLRDATPTYLPVAATAFRVYVPSGVTVTATGLYRGA